MDTGCHGTDAISSLFTLRGDGCLLFSGIVHLPLRSIDIDDHGYDLCGQGPNRCREDVDQFSTNRVYVT